MCVIAVARTGTLLPSFGMLHAMWEANPHGAGFMYPSLTADNRPMVRAVKGLMSFNALKRELQCYLTVTRPRPARWWKRRPPAHDGCSFCGRTYAESGQLVNGPGVAICRNCIALAADILHTRQSAH